METPPEPAAVVEPAAPAIDKRHTALFKPLPTQMPSDANPITPEKVALGRVLYYDTRLSTNDSISCNSCHMLDRYGVDNEPTSPGHEGKRGGRNSPTVYHAALHATQFWDGRAKDVEEQAKGPILNPVEMGMGSDADVIAKLKAIPGYPPLFAAAFPGEAEPITYDNLARAIGAFERGLVTPSPFDAYLAGDASALTDEQKKGVDTSIAVGCTTCHMGVAVGGEQFQKLGLVEAYATTELGRYEVTKVESDKYLFKVPSLRNVTKTGPYFHDGSVATLDEAIRLMGKHQLGRELTPEEITSISAFLGALEGPLPTEYIAKPEMPL
jgi:cytochrome c peroxidase